MSSIKIDIPIVVLESLFTALHSIKPMQVSKLEMKAIGVLKSALYFELEQMILDPEEIEQNKTNFKKLFEEQRSKNKSKVHIEELSEEY